MVERRLPFEVEHRVHDVFQRLGSGDAAALGHMTHHDHRGTGLLGEAHQPGGALAHLAHVAGRALEQVGVDRLDRIEDQQVGAERRGRVENASSRVSPTTCTGPASSSSRAARSRSCSGDSSPLA